MSLVFASITPHPPILIPLIGKEGAEKLQKTREALLTLERELYVKKPGTIIIITPHQSLYSDAFVINAHTNFISAFDEFGDFSTKKEWRGNPELASKISHVARLKNTHLHLVSDEKIDYGATIPLFFTTEHLRSIKILPVGFSSLSPKEHLAFGEILKDVIMNSHERVAIIASGDLSHTLTTDSPGGYHRAGEEFDTKLIELLETRNTAGLIGFDEKMVKDAQECGYRSILILLGILKNMNYTFKNLCYEAPFGVGYLTGEFAM